MLTSARALTCKRDALLLSARAELPPTVELAVPPADAPSAIFDIFSFAEAAGASLVLPSSTSVVSPPSPPSPATPPRAALTEEDLTNLARAAEEAAEEADRVEIARLTLECALQLDD